MKKNKTIIIITGLIIVFMIFFVISTLKSELINKPILKDKIDQKEYTDIYNFYSNTKPSINNLEEYGSKNASITMVVYIDPTSKNIDYFLENIFPTIKKEYIDTNNVKFYFKNYITNLDLKEKSERYIKVKTINCIYKIKKEKYYNFIFQMKSNEYKIDEFMNQNNISSQQFYSCLNNQSLNKMKEDVSEIYQLGLVGLNPRIYIGIKNTENTIINGIPNIDRIKKVIRDKKITLGKFN